jgi:hypothetical protein
MHHFTPGAILEEEIFLENEARSCSMDPTRVTPEYVCRMLGGSMAPEDIAESLKKAKALLR